MALLAAERGAHVVIADRDLESATRVTEEVRSIVGKEAATVSAVDIRSRDSIRETIRQTVSAFGGLDILVNTAALFRFVGVGCDLG